MSKGAEPAKIPEWYDNKFNLVSMYVGLLNEQLLDMKMLYGSGRFVSIETLGRSFLENYAIASHLIKHYRYSQEHQDFITYDEFCNCLYALDLKQEIMIYENIRGDYPPSATEEERQAIENEWSRQEKIKGDYIKAVVEREFSGVKVEPLNQSLIGRIKSTCNTGLYNMLAKKTDLVLSALELKETLNGGYLISKTSVYQELCSGAHNNASSVLHKSIDDRGVICCNLETTLTKKTLEICQLFYNEVLEETKYIMKRMKISNKDF